MIKRKKKEILVLAATAAYLAFFYYQLLQPVHVPAADNRVHIVHYIYYPVIYEKKLEGAEEDDNNAREGAHRHIIEQINHFAERETAVEAIQSSDGYQKAQQQEENMTKPADSSKNLRRSSRQSKLLVSGHGVAKALSRLSWRDKLWLANILSRCSLKELLVIKDILKDGVTREENREMYLMLRNKISDEEQKKLDSLIELYTKD